MALEVMRSGPGTVGQLTAGVKDVNGVLATVVVPAFIALSAGGAFPTGADGTAAIPVKASSGNVANAVATATIPAIAGKTAYITGFDITGSGATAGAVVNPTITGLLGGITTYSLTVSAGVATADTALQRDFTPGFPASAVNTAIVVSCPALGAGNTNNTVNVYGFYI
jgi:hypothetical protein